MERQKRIYPANLAKWHLCAAMLSLTFLAVMMGLLQKDNDDFLLEAQPLATAIPLEVGFDDTPVETELEIPAYQWFALQLGAFESEESALEMARSFQAKGAAGFLWRDGRYRVLAAVYPEKEEAQRVRNQLQEQHTIDSYLYLIDYPTMKLKVKGMKGQVEILQAAFLHAHELAAQLYNIVIAVDRGEISVEEVRTKLISLDEQISIVSLRLQQRYPSQKPEITHKFLECFDAFSDFVAQSKQIDSTLLFSTKLKYQTLCALFGIQEIYQTLYNT